MDQFLNIDPEDVFCPTTAIPYYVRFSRTLYVYVVCTTHKAILNQDFDFEALRLTR
jgi:hypothetical protein